MKRRDKSLDSRLNDQQLVEQLRDEFMRHKIEGRKALIQIATAKDAGELVEAGLDFTCMTPDLITEFICKLLHTQSPRVKQAVIEYIDWYFDPDAEDEE